MKLQRYFSLLYPVVAASQSSAICRCLYGQPCWPDQSAFAALSANVSQPLLQPVPPAHACYPPSSPSGNCTNVIANFYNGSWRSDQPGALQNINFETFTFQNGTIDGCYLNTTLGFPCDQGSVPPVGVDARVVGDIQAAVKFAVKYNLRLVVKNTGHDYLGRSTARGGFSIWTHHLKDITFNASFVPEGASSTNETYNAVTLGAGVQWNEAYVAAHQQGRFVIGGLSAGGSVGAAGGWVMGGGHSAFSSRHGLGVDNVIQFTIVDSAGDHLTANAHKNPDLFWALRGGGGGTYGVVTSATYRTYPEFPLTVPVVKANFSSPAVAQQVVTQYVKLHPGLAAAGWGGYSSLSNDNIEFFYTAPNISTTEANATLLSFLEFTQNATGGALFFTMLSFDSFYSAYESLFANAIAQVGYSVEIASRLLSTELTISNPETVAETMLAVDGGVSMNFVAGGAVAKADPESTGLNPAWRKTLGEVYVTVGWPAGSPNSIVNLAVESLKNNTEIIDRLSVDSASYLNEGSLYEKDFKKTYFGAHYNSLKSIKTKYDSRGLFVVAEGVGSEDWDASLNCRL